MKTIIFFLLASVTFNRASAQFPDEATIKKHKIKTIAAAGDGGTEYMLFDENGYQIKQAYMDEEFKKPHTISHVYYNATKKPDSIITTSQYLNSKEYFYYSSDGSFINVTVSGDKYDSSWYNKKGKVIKRNYSSGANIKYEYNAQGQLIKLTDTSKRGMVSITSFNYNTLSQLISKTTKGEYDTSTTKYEYNKQGLLVREIRGSGWTTTYYYTFR